MDDGPVYERGGFGDSRASRLSEGLEVRAAAEQQMFDEAAAKAERERTRRAELFQERALQSAIAQAMEAGEHVNPRQAMRGLGIGHTPREFIQMRSAVMDREDAHLELVAHAAFVKWQREQAADMSGDTSAPTKEALEAGHQMQARAKRYREREHDRELVARGIRAGVY
jgi:hypothetical protein